MSAEVGRATSDEAIVEAAALSLAHRSEWLLSDHPDDIENFRASAAVVLASLRSGGYEWYRPDTHRLYRIVPEPYHPPAYPTIESEGQA